MSLSLGHLFSQRDVISALSRVALSGRGGSGPVHVGQLIEEIVAPRPGRLVLDYIEHVGGSAERWVGQLPPHMFPQVTFPASARAMAGLPYPLTRVLNLGCHMTMNEPLFDTEPLLVRAKLVSVDDDGQRAKIEQLITLGPVGHPEALVVRQYAYIPLGGGKREAKAREPRVVPAGARLVKRCEVGRGAGLSFAALTGDINPLHWAPVYGKLLGFGGPILHGFATMARAYEAIVGERGEREGRLSTFEARFVKPVPLPGEFGVYVSDDGRYHVGVGPGAPTFVEGSYSFA